MCEVIYLKALHILLFTVSEASKYKWLCLYQLTLHLQLCITFQYDDNFSEKYTQDLKMRESTFYFPIQLVKLRRLRQRCITLIGGNASLQLNTCELKHQFIFF